MKKKISTQKKRSNGVKADVSQSLPPIEKAWDWNSRAVPEDGYSIEEFFWVIGKDVMLKKDFIKCVKGLFKELYKQIKHGDKQHQRWLKKKIDAFIGGNID